MQDVSTCREANADSDHHLVVVRTNLRVVTDNKKNNTRKKWNIIDLEIEEKRRKCAAEMEINTHY